MRMWGRCFVERRSWGVSRERSRSPGLAWHGRRDRQGIGDASMEQMGNGDEEGCDVQGEDVGI